MGPSEERMPEGRTIRSYVLRSGRMSAAQGRWYDGLLPRWGVPVPRGDAAGRPLDFAAVFGNGNPVIAEIGFGAGTATAAIAGENPGRNYLAVEVFRPGIGRLLHEIEKRGLSNIRILEGDAAEVFPALVPDRSLQGVHIFFPDPWPKKRHHKRRLVKRPFTDLLAGKLRPPEGACPAERACPPEGAGPPECPPERADPADGGGERPYLYMVTDWEDYARTALAALSDTPGIGNPWAAGGGFAPPRPWRPETKFEARGTAKRHVIRELYFEVSYVQN